MFLGAKSLLFRLLLQLTPAPAPVLPPAENGITALTVEANTGNPKAQVQLGLKYAEGEGGLADQAQALRWFQKAAEQGDASAEYYLGEMYLTGRGHETDHVQAFEWLRKSAEQGDSRAQFNIGVMYSLGEGVAKDPAEASLWMRKAAEQGLAAGQFGLGSMYANGLGVERDEKEASAWYRKAAAQEDPSAMNNLALLLATSTDPQVCNPNEAIVFARRAADLQPKVAAIRDTLATAYFANGEPDKAVDAERQALALKPGTPSYQQALERYQAATAKPKP